MPETPGVPDSDAGLRAANARLRELLMERDTRIAEQDAEIAVLRERLAGLQSQVADLAARVKANSRNSSRPPSSDGLAKPAPKSLRGKSGRKPGRPKGQPGATMQLTDHPDKKAVAAPVQYGPRIMGAGVYLWHGQFLSRDRACQALAERAGCAPSPGALAAAARKTAGLIAPALKEIARHLISSVGQPEPESRVQGTDLPDHRELALSG